MTEDQQKFFDHAEDLLQVYSEVQDSVKIHMKSIAEASMTELPPPNFDILETNEAKIAFSPSNLSLNLIMDQKHNQEN